MAVRGIVRLAVMVAVAVPYVAPHRTQTLPVLFTRPLHYQVLGKLRPRGALGGINEVSWNRSVLGRWLRESRKLGANALLLKPICRSSWFCRATTGIGIVGGRRWRLAFGDGGTSGSGRSRFRRHGMSVERYAAEAIRVRGSPCVLPFECWTIREILVNGRRWRQMGRRDDTRYFSISGQPFGLSIAVSGSMKTPHGTSVGHMTGFPRGHLRCPIRWEFYGERFYETNWLPVVATPALAIVATGGRVMTGRLVIPGDGIDIDTDRLVARFLRHWRFTGAPVQAHAVHLLMDWHLVPLPKGQPIPRGVVCEYPAYPSSGWKHGKMIRRLRWPVYALSEGRRRVFFAANPAPAKTMPRPTSGRGPGSGPQTVNTSW